MGILLLLSNAGWYIPLITMRFQPVTQRIHDKCTYYCNYSTYPAFKTFVWMNGRILPLSICMPNKVYIPFRIHIIRFMSIWDSSNTSTVYSHSLFSLYTPLQTTKTGFSVCFPNEKKKKSDHSYWMNPSSKGQGDSVQRDKVCNSRFSRLNSCRLKVDCQVQCRKIYWS